MMTWPITKKVFWSEEQLITEFSRKRPPVSSSTPTFPIDTPGNTTNYFKVYWETAKETEKA